MFVYFVPQKITAPNLGAPLCWRPGATLSALLPAATVLDTANAANKTTNRKAESENHA